MIDNIVELEAARRTLDDAPVPERSPEMLDVLREVNGLSDQEFYDSLDDSEFIGDVVDVEDLFDDPRRKAELVSIYDFSTPEGFSIWHRYHTVKKIKKQPFF